jgi:hypothetical protein
MSSGSLQPACWWPLAQHLERLCTGLGIAIVAVEQFLAFIVFSWATRAPYLVCTSRRSCRRAAVKLLSESLQDKESERTHHTGFGNADFDLESSSSSQCIAIGWGHTSRVWKVQFLESAPCEGALFLLSAGEDATSRTWKLSLNTGDEEVLPYKLIQQDCAAHHSGKNIWSSTTYGGSIRQQRVACGAADAKITSHPLIRTSERTQGRRIHEYTVLDLLSRAQLSNSNADAMQPSSKPSKKADFLRSYCFLDHETFLLTTNFGKVVLGLLKSQPTTNHSSGLAEVALVDQLDDLSGYSICTGDIETGHAFVAGARGAIYMFSQNSKILTKLGSVDGKIGDLFARHVLLPNGQGMTLLLATLVGHKEAVLLYIDAAVESGPSIIRTVAVPVSEPSTGSTITSMALAPTSEDLFLYLGFRRGSVAVYIISSDLKGSNAASLSRVIERAHGMGTFIRQGIFRSLDFCRKGWVYRRPAHRLDYRRRRDGPQSDPADRAER